MNNSERLEQWRRAVKRQGDDGKLCTLGKGNTLCSDHFKGSDYQVRPGADRKLLEPQVIPTVFSTYPLHAHVFCKNVCCIAN